MPHRIALWLYEVCLRFDQTPPSQWIQVHGKSVVPALQTIHILSIARVMTSALMIGLRLAGLFGRDQPLERTRHSRS